MPMVVPPAAAMTMLTPQPIAPDVAIPVPVPMSPKNQGLPLPVEPANNNLIEQQRREWTVRGADTGGGGAVPAATGATELLVDATATTVIDGYYVYGFDYVAGMTDRDEKAGFMPQTDFVVSTHAI
ncbi:MAG TPA: hypothetical protein PKM88_06885 [bacterium]|nr:hypothetical protein [bacterium]